MNATARSFSKRLTGRVAALVNAPLPAEMLVPELAIALQRAVGTDGALPIVLTTDPAQEPPHAFRVWRGAETNTDELRGLLQLGVWPGPSTLPSLQHLLREPAPRSVYAAALWGEGCNEDGPWVPLWRERQVRHGYYLVAFTAAGSVVAVLLSRRPASAAFTAHDIAAGTDLVRFITAVANRAAQQELVCDVVADEAPIAVSAACRMTSLGIGGPELLRDLGGGGDGARAQGRYLVEHAARRFHAAVLDQPSVATVAAAVTPTPEEDAVFMRNHFSLVMDGRARTPRKERVATTVFGTFELQLVASNDLQTGATQILGTLRRLVPRSLAVVRALVETDAPGREIELALQLVTGKSLTEISEALGVAPASAKTLLRRLGDRFGASGREHVVQAMVQRGSAVIR